VVCADSVMAGHNVCESYQDSHMARIARDFLTVVPRVVPSRFDKIGQNRIVSKPSTRCSNVSKLRLNIVGIIGRRRRGGRRASRREIACGTCQSRGGWLPKLRPKNFGKLGPQFPEL
jgi:hypothetical protein